MKKPQIVLTGVLNWQEFRDKLVKDLSKCESEERFGEMLLAIGLSISRSEEEMQAKRRALGIPET